MLFKRECLQTHPKIYIIIKKAQQFFYVLLGKQPLKWKGKFLR